MVRACAVVLGLVAVTSCKGSGTRPAETPPGAEAGTGAATERRDTGLPSTCDEAMEAVVGAAWDRSDCSHAESVFARLAPSCGAWKSRSTDTEWRDLMFELAHCHEVTGSVESARRWYREILARPDWEAHRAVVSASGDGDGWAHTRAETRLQALQRSARPRTCIASRTAFIAELRRRLAGRRVPALRQLVARDFVWCTAVCGDTSVEQGLRWLQQELPSKPLTFGAADSDCVVTEGWSYGDPVAFLLTKVDGCYALAGVQVPAQCELDE